MKISNDSLLGNIVESKYNAAVSDMSKTLAQMKSGDIFSGTVVDIKQNSVTLQLDNNIVINAKSLINPDLRIGEKAVFTVKESNAGQIFVEISKTEEGTANFIKELLNNAEMPVTKENIELVKFLIDNNMPVDKKTISDALYFKYANEENINKSGDSLITDIAEKNSFVKDTDVFGLNGTLGKENISKNNVLEKVLFLLKEDMPTGKVSVDTLNRLIDNHTGLKAEFSFIASKISKMPDGELKSKLLDILEINKNNLSSKNIQKAVREKLFFSEDDFKSHRNLSEKFEKIFEISSKSSEVISKVSEDIHNGALKQSFDNIRNDLNFMKEIDNYKQYVQIPVNVNGREGECELHIFKNSKNNKNFSQKASVLLALDYFFVGKIDAFIEKTNRNLAFQFRCERKETFSLIKKNINELSNMLGNYGFRITNVDYKEKDETFNVIKSKNGGNGKKDSNRRYSFDMRV